MNWLRKRTLMNRAKLGSILFLGGLLFVVVAERNDAHADAPVTTPAAKVVSATADTKAEVVPANAGLKAVAAPEVGTSGSCGEGMLEVEGDYCSDLEQKCNRYIDPEGVFPRRCAEFAPTGKCTGKTTKKHFCIDKFEWPNKPGENPVVMKTWYEARDACAGVGKRLCGDSEWTLACEGQERLPYPYGYARNAEACNIDKPHPEPNAAAMFDPKRRAAEFARLDQRDPSGAREACVSPYGVSYKSGSKGGYWGPVRTRCRPMTTAHFEMFSFYQLGFRCCADAQAPEPSEAGPSAGLVGPRRLGVAASGRVALLPGS
jgi:hypothetical protein